MPHPTQPEPPQPGWRRLGNRVEGRVLAIGLALALASTGALTATWTLNPDLARLIGAVVVSNIMFGFAAGLSVGYAAHLSHALVIPVNMLVETVVVLLFYPLFVLGWNRASATGPLQRLVQRTVRMAERHQERIRRYGLPGLLLFVMVPFWMTGPVVGCAIGHMLGFRARTNLTVVLTGSYLATFGFALLLKGLEDRLAQVGAWAPLLLVAIIIGVAVAGHFLRPPEK